MIKLANQIENIEIDEEDLNEVETIINSNVLINLSSGRRYMFWGEKEFEELIQRLLTNFSKKYLEQKNA